MNDSSLSDKIEKLESISGVNFIIIICILGEPNIFPQFTSGKKLVSYEGLDINQKESRLKIGKSKISKQKKSFLRNALYMSALCLSRHNLDMKIFYYRINQNKPREKIHITTVSRKTLIIMKTV